MITKLLKNWLFRLDSLCEKFGACEKLEFTKDKLAKSFIEEGTRIPEVGLAARLMQYGISAMSFDNNGGSLAPFLSSAFSFLSFDKFYWFFVLFLAGFLHLYVVITHWNPKTYKCLDSRIVMIFVQMFLLTTITAAIGTGGKPILTSINYAIGDFFCCWVCVVLIAKRTYRKSFMDGLPPNIAVVRESLK